MIKFRKTDILGVFIIDMIRNDDARGYFTRTYCADEFAAQGIDFKPVQASLSHNKSKGTLRGMHYQGPTARESKLVRCITGSVWDVMVDMRVDSPTYLKHFGIELSSDNGLSVYIPEFVAHGFQALVNGAQVSYLMDSFYESHQSRGIRFDDPVISIQWPLEVTLTSSRDLEWPLISSNHGK